MSANALGFLIIYVLGLILAFFRHPMFGLYSYLWCFYNWPEPSKWWAAQLPGLRWSLIAAIITLFAALRISPSPSLPPWHANWGARLLIAFVSWMWLQNIWQISGSYHFEGCILFTKYLVLFFILYRIMSDEKKIEHFFWGHIIGCFIFGWLAYNSPVSGRLEGIGGPGVSGANAFAMHLTTGLAFAGYMFLGMRGMKRWLAFATIPFILNGIILDASRGAFLGLLSAALAASVLTSKTHKRGFYSGAILGVVLLHILAHDLFWDRMASIGMQNEEMDASAQSRIELISYGWQMVRDHPLGAGFYGHAVLSPHYLPEYLMPANAEMRAAHNTFMAILVEQGYPGVILFISLVVWCTIVLIRLKVLDKKGLSSSLALYRAALGSALMSLFVAGQFGNFIKAEVGIWLICLLAVLSNVSYESVNIKAK